MQKQETDSPKNGFFEITINDFDEFIELIRPDKENLKTHFDYKNKFLLFRGQSDSTWDLTPNLFRSIPHYIVRRANDLCFIEWFYLKALVENCDQGGIQLPSDSLEFRTDFLKEFPDKFAINPKLWPSEEYYELLAFAQHYEISTQLLDWTKQPLIACYFAASGAIKNCSDLNKSFSIWCLNKEGINTLNNDIKIIEVPKSLNQNISSQQGCFTLIRQDITRNTEYTYDDEKKRIKEVKLLTDLLAKKEEHQKLAKITLPYKYALDLLNYCDSYSINAISIFRGIHGVTQHFKDGKNRYHFKNQLDNWKVNPPH